MLFLQVMISVDKVFFPEANKLFAFDRSEMHIIRTALYTNGVWDVTGEMGRFVPPLAVFAVFTLIQRQHLTAALIRRTN